MKQFFIFFYITLSISYSSVLVVKAKRNINYKNNITKNNTFLVNVNDLKESCVPLTKKDILSKNYRAKMVLKKGRIICKNNVFIIKRNRLVFNFGNIEIEKNGRIIKETDEYIRVMDVNGKIEKIYKNGYPK